jgi:hypothetical protein
MSRLQTNRSRGAAVAFVLTLLVLSSPQALVAGAQVSQQSQQQTSSSRGAGVFIDHGIALMNSADRVTLDWLIKQTGSNVSTAAFEKVIQSNFAPVDARKVLLDIGWQNFTVGHVPHQTWVDDWLTASDAYGIRNLVFLGQLSTTGYGSPWILSLIGADPAARTYFANGTAAEYVSVDNPDVAKALEVDLYQLYTYYGNHPSWVGLGTGYPQGDPYYPTGTAATSSNTPTTLPLLGYSNASLLAFANSQFFALDTNQSGFGGNGASPGDLLQSSFKHVEPSILLNSGNWMTSSGYPVKGDSSTGQRVAMRISLPQTQGPITASWYGSAVGSPGNLSVSLARDVGGTYSLASALETVVLPAANVSAIVGWQPQIQFLGNLTAGSYWVIFSSPSSAGPNYFNVFLRNYKIGNEVAYALTGSGKELGYSVLWVRDALGNDIVIYPFEDSYIPPPQQAFVATSAFQFNQVFLFLSDRHFDPTNGTLAVTDVTAGRVVAQGVLSQAVTHGLQNWTPIQLNQTVSAVSGHNYTLSVTEPAGGYSWGVVLRGLTVSPAKAGFEGQRTFWLFRLGLISWSQSHFDYDVITSNGADSVRAGYEDAIRLTPTSKETLQSVQILMYNAQGGGNYSSGSLTVGIWSSAPNGNAPLQPITSVTIPGGEVPMNGWLSINALNMTTTGGVDRWIVISTNSSTTFSLARLTSPYGSFVQISKDGGKSWQLPAEGPSEYSHRAVLSNEVLGPAVSGIPQVQLSEESKFAQPIQVTAATQVKGIYLGIFTRQTSDAPNNYLRVSINPDDGSGKPSQQSLASGVYYGDNITFLSPDLVQFSSTARLSPGERYWLVVQPVGGTYNVYPVVYWNTPSGDSPAYSMISGNNGFTWGRYSNQTTILSYALASPIRPNPTFDTKQLSNDLAALHNFPTDVLPLKGWNAYVQTSEVAMLSEVAGWLQQNTGRSFDFEVSAQPAVLNATAPTTLSPLPIQDPYPDCYSLQRYLLQVAPTTDEQLYLGGGLRLLNGCAGSLVSNYAQLLNEIPFLPNGQSTGTNDTNSNATSRKISSPVWQTGTGSKQSPDITYSISGGFQGPLVVWISNAGQSPENLSLSLDLSQLGITGAWVSLDLSNLKVQDGTTKVATLDVTVPALSWEPVMISQYNGNFAVQYSNAAVLRQFPYPNQGLYFIQAPKNQSVLVMISSSSPLQSVLLDSGQSLPVLTANEISAARPGWNYTKGPSMLIVDFVSSGNDTFRVLSYVPPNVPPPVFPWGMFIEALVAFVAIDVAIVAYVRFSRKGKSR